MTRKKKEAKKTEPKLVHLPPIDKGYREVQPRDRCSECGKPIMAARIDKSGTIKIMETKVGRPKKGAMNTRYKRIGSWCKYCDLFYYENGTPNYLLRPAAGRKISESA